MAETYREIEVQCPFCEKVKTIRVPDHIFAQKRFGMIKVQIPYGGVCDEHQFLVFIDIKGNVRGYEKIDLVMKTMKENISEKPSRESIDLTYFIKNYGLYGTFCLIHAKVFNYPIYVLREKWDESTLSQINGVLNNLIPENYKVTNMLIFLEKMNYDSSSLKDTRALIMDDQQHILQTPWDIKLKLKLEEELTQKALEILNEKEQISILKKGIENFIKESEYVKDVLENVKSIYEENLIDQISHYLMEPKVTRYRLLLIKEFIKNRFSEKLVSKIKSKVEDFLGQI